MSSLKSKECGCKNGVLVGRGSLYCDILRISERYTDIVSFTDVVFFYFLAEKLKRELVRDGSL